MCAPKAAKGVVRVWGEGISCMEAPGTNGQELGSGQKQGAASGLYCTAARRYRGRLTHEACSCCPLVHGISTRAASSPDSFAHWESSQSAHSCSVMCNEGVSDREINPLTILGIVKQSFKSDATGFMLRIASVKRSRQARAIVFKADLLLSSEGGESL